MKGSLAIAVLILWGSQPLFSGDIGYAEKRTEIVITDIDSRYPSPDGVYFRLEAEVRGATASSQVVVLIRTSNRGGLWPAVARDGKPRLPTTEDPLPHSLIDASEYEEMSRWVVEFYASERAGRLIEVYAIVCSVKEREDWSRLRDYQGFVFLPFDRAKDIGDALEILADFGWVPTGFTIVKP